MDTRKQITKKKGQLAAIQKRIPALRVELNKVNDSIRALKTEADEATRAALLDEGDNKTADKARATFDAASAKQRSLADQIEMAEQLLTSLSNEIADLRRQADREDAVRLTEVIPSRLEKLEGAATEYFALWSLLLASRAGERDAGLAPLHEGGAFRALVGEDRSKAVAFLEKIAALRRDLVGESV